MRLDYLLIIGIVILHSCKETGSAVPKSDILSIEQSAKIDSICQSFIKKENTIGFSIGISKNGNILFSKGYGLANITSDKAATDSTVYPIASVSKFITAIATMKMVEEGKLNLSDKVIDHLNEFPRQKYMDEITIEHLLRHQSGLIDHEDWFDSIYIEEKRVFTTQELYAFLDQPLFFRPGTNYSYSNSGYVILSAILETLEKKPFHQLIEEKISRPSGLNSLGMWPLNWGNANATLGYELIDGKVDTSLHMMTKAMKGDGGLSSSVLDLLKLMNKLTNGSIISKSSLYEMLTPTPIGNISIDYGLGVKFGHYIKHKTFGHSGGYKGTTWAILMHYPESGYTFAAAINTNYSPEEVLMLRHLIMPIVLKTTPPELDYNAQVENIENYIGEYRAFNRWGNGNPSVRIASSNNGKLFWSNPDTKTPAAQLFQKNDSVFTWAAFPYDNIRFHHVNGKVVACSEYYDGMFGMVRLKSDRRQNTKRH